MSYIEDLYKKLCVSCDVVEVVFIIEDTNPRVIREEVLEGIDYSGGYMPDNLSFSEDSEIRPALASIGYDGIAIHIVEKSKIK